MLFCAISEEKTRVSGALSFYCRNTELREKKRSLLQRLSLVIIIFLKKLWKSVNAQGKKYLILARQNKLET